MVPVPGGVFEGSNARICLSDVEAISALTVVPFTVMVAEVPLKLADW